MTFLFLVQSSAVQATSLLTHLISYLWLSLISTFEVTARHLHMKTVSQIWTRLFLSNTRSFVRATLITNCIVLVTSFAIPTGTIAWPIDCGVYLNSAILRDSCSASSVLFALVSMWSSLVLSISSTSISMCTSSISKEGHFLVQNPWTCVTLSLCNSVKWRYSTKSFSVSSTSSLCHSIIDLTSSMSCIVLGEPTYQ